MLKILVVEDDRDTARYFASVLKAAGYEVACAPDGKAALDATADVRYDLLVVDVMMPRMDGYQLVDAIRSCGDETPVLMVTAKTAPAERRRGFLVGTDDYLAKPVDPGEMVLRVKALLRRAHIVSSRQMTVGDAVLDYDRLTCSRPGEEVVLPPKEFYLLYKLLAYPGQVFTRLQLMDEIWGMDSESDFNTVNVHINRLRKRFADWTQFEIQTVRGLGYKAVKKA